MEPGESLSARGCVCVYVSVSVSMPVCTCVVAIVRSAPQPELLTGDHPWWRVPRVSVGDRDRVIGYGAFFVPLLLYCTAHPLHERPQTAARRRLAAPRGISKRQHYSAIRGFVRGEGGVSATGRSANSRRASQARSTRALGFPRRSRGLCDTGRREACSTHAGPSRRRPPVSKRSRALRTRWVFSRIESCAGSLAG